MSNTDFLWNINGNTLDLIKFSDAKATAILGINGILLGLYFYRITGQITPGRLNIVEFLGILLGLAFTVASSSLSAYSIFPRVSTNRPSELIFFEDLFKKFKTPEEYERATSEAFKNGNSDFISQLTAQIWLNSRVAHIKYALVRKSVILLLVSFVITAITVAILTIGD